MGHLQSQPEQYWVAVRQEHGMPLTVFGPYTAEQAEANRAQWRKTYSSSVTISEVFKADSRDHAYEHARLIMPSHRQS